MTLTDFLQARIAEEIAEAEAGDPTLLTERLRTCQVHRLIAELHHPHPEYDAQACVLCQWDIDCESPRHDHQFEIGVRTEWPCETILALASLYADHPDYRPEWRP